MQCSREESLIRLFYNSSSSFHLLLLFLYVSSILLSKIFHFLCSYPIIHRDQNGVDYSLFSDEEEEEQVHEQEEEEEVVDGGYFYGGSPEKDHLVADVIHGGDGLRFWDYYNPEDFTSRDQEAEKEEEEEEEEYHTTEQFPCNNQDSPSSEPEHEVVEEEEEEGEISTTKYSDDTVYDSAPNQEDGPTTPFQQNKNEDEIFVQDKRSEARISADGRFFVFEPTTRLEPRKKLPLEDKDRDRDDDEEIQIFGDSCTVGSTSKSSSEWRSRYSGTDDPFSSSSRRSCRKWASYTVFQKYDEEMLFLDRISAQKLHETESLRSFQANPRSMSERIVRKISTINKRQSSDMRHNPYHELEAAYVAQICITWEALNCNYINFQRKRSVRRDFDPGCPGHIAQQFQQFQVLLQRYIENEPYEQGRRPEVYARMRLLAPKLLLVPEYRDSEEDEEDHKEEGFGSRVSSASFLMIMEEGIRTFMDFLKADKERPCQVVKAFLFKRNRRGSVDPTLLNLMKKVNTKKKMKLKDLRRAGKCIRRKRLKVEEEMEILMGLIDLKVVSRVLRMSGMSEEQLQWAEEKMSKVRVMEGKLQRDSTPLFFPAHD